MELADAADTVTLRAWSADGVPSRLKSDGSPVTAADLAAEQAVLAAVRAAHPHDGFLGEEVGGHRGGNGRRWIIDGIDSTRSFAAGLATWGTLVALEEDGKIVLGVASSPAQGADACVWFCGDIWDHAAPSVIVEEAGGRFTDHFGGRRLDTRTAVYSNGACHDDVLSALQRAQRG